MTAKPALSGLPLEDLEQALCTSGLPAFRARQIFRALARGAASFAEITELPLPLREELEQRFTLRSGVLSARLEDPDGTLKVQISLKDGLGIEAVLLADQGLSAQTGADRPASQPHLRGRVTACLSTQAGCPAGCIFCKTGALGFARNLSASEIVEQFLYLRSLSPDIDNIVIMGMGEPLLNLSELRKALTVLTDPRGLGLSKRRITVSTCGIIEGIRDMADAGPDIRLALSLTAAEEKLREKLMPISRANPLGELKEALRYYQRKQRRRITLEAVLLSGINTRREDAKAMADFVRGLDAAINLIPWNPVHGMDFEGKALRAPAPGETARFVRDLCSLGLKVTTRYRRGRSVAGACGQLGSLEALAPIE